MGAGNLVGVLERVAERENIFRDAEGSLSFSLCAISVALGQVLFDIGLKEDANILSGGS